MQSYKQLVFWRKSIILIKEIYKLTEEFPKTEIYNLISQIKRSAVSIALNIAEGYGRKNKKEKAQFFNISYASALELEAQLEIARELSFINSRNFLEVNNLLQEICKMLYVYREKIYKSI